MLLGAYAGFRYLANHSSIVGGRQTTGKDRDHNKAHWESCQKHVIPKKPVFFKKATSTLFENSQTAAADDALRGFPYHVA